MTRATEPTPSTEAPATRAGLALLTFLNDVKDGLQAMEDEDDPAFAIVAIEREARGSLDDGLHTQGNTHGVPFPAAAERWDPPKGPSWEESAALNAGTHEPAVDDFGNQYLARVGSLDDGLSEAWRAAEELVRPLRDRKHGEPWALTIKTGGQRGDGRYTASAHEISQGRGVAAHFELGFGDSPAAALTALAAALAERLRSGS